MGEKEEYLCTNCRQLPFSSRNDRLQRRWSALSSISSPSSIKCHKNSHKTISAKTAFSKIMWPSPISPRRITCGVHSSQIAIYEFGVINHGQLSNVQPSQHRTRGRHPHSWPKPQGMPAQRNTGHWPVPPPALKLAPRPWLVQPWPGITVITPPLRKFCHHRPPVHTFYMTIIFNQWTPYLHSPPSQ